MTEPTNFDFATIGIGDRFYLCKHEFMITDTGTRALVGVEKACLRAFFDEDEMEVVSLHPPSPQPKPASP